MQNSNYFGHHAVTIASCPGRLRIKVPRLLRSDDEKIRIESDLVRYQGIDAVYANPLTGNVLILFDFKLPATTVLLALGISTAAPRKKTPATAVAGKPVVPKTPPPQQRHADYPPWHLRDAAAALAFHQTNACFGLSSQVVRQRLKQGMNLLPQKQARSSADILLAQFRSLPVALLGFSACLSLLTGGIGEAVAIAAVLLMNGSIGFATERRAETAIASLSELIDDTVPVLRDGQVDNVAASHVVPGDILILAPGVRLAADARIIQASGLRIDESALTGESKLAEKEEAVLRQAVALADRVNMAYKGTAVTMGSGMAVVVGTGANTELGTIQALMVTTRPPKTPLQKQLDRIGNRSVMISTVLCVAVFVIGMLRGQGLLQMLKASISLALAAVPEGLPTVATTTLARGIRSMRERGMMVRRLQAIETLGAIHAICLDKTGTLTLNRMSVVSLQVGAQYYERGSNGLLPDDLILERDDALSRLLLICVLSNESSVRNGQPASPAATFSPDASPLFNGSSTENALIQLALDAGLPVEKVRERFPLLESELRGEGRNFMKTVHADARTSRRLTTIKGNPAEVLAQCSHYHAGEGIVAMDDTLRQQVLRRNDEMAQRQLRVLGFAYADGSCEQSVWLGLAGLADPIRPGAEKVIAALHRAGIRTMMITGDQPATAAAVGESLGLHDGRRLRMVEAEHLEQHQSEGVASPVADAHVFARVSPARKLDIVQALQQHGDVIAMTGDGINDGPALQAADVGIAMGLHGTDLARSAADVVLMDDRLETVIEAVRQGRTISQNIGKSVHYLLSHNLSEILVVFGATAAGRTPPLTPLQLLWVNLLSDVLPAIALATEPAEADIMQRPPRPAGKHLIDNEQLKRYALEGSCMAGGTLAAYLYGVLRYGTTPQAGGMAFNTLVLGTLLHSLSCRSDRHSIFSSTEMQPNKKLNLAIGGSIALQLLANLVPGLRGTLGTARLGIMDMAVALAGAGLPLLLNEAMKEGRNHDARGE